MADAKMDTASTDIGTEIRESADEYVGFWIRVGASLIDSVILMLIIAPLVTLIYGREYWLGESLVAGPLDFLLTWVFPAVAVVLLWQWRQATPGKMVFRARIVDAKTGDVPTTRQWIVRYLGYFVSTFPLGLGLLWVGWDRRKQGWHDKLAGTVVIRPKDKGVAPVEFEARDA